MMVLSAASSVASAATIAASRVGRQLSKSGQLRAWRLPWSRDVLVARATAIAVIQGGVVRVRVQKLFALKQVDAPLGMSSSVDAYLSRFVDALSRFAMRWTRSACSVSVSSTWRFKHGDDGVRAA